MIKNFDEWFAKLTSNQQQELLDHIFNNHIKSLNEGVFVGPAVRLVKGILSSDPSSLNICPKCKRPY